MGRSLTVKQDLIDQHRKDTDQLLRSLMRTPSPSGFNGVKRPSRWSTTR